MKQIGVLTSGGDAPGINACIAAIIQTAESNGALVRGIMHGFRGLLEANTIPIGSELAGLARRGGTFLGTSRNGNLDEKVRQADPRNLLQRCGVEGIVVIGGGGSLEATARMAAEGIPVVGIPCTIDNDIPGTDYCLGFDSAVNKGIQAADELMDTAESLTERIFIIETLGGKTGHLALAIGYAVGADAVFIPEFDIPFQKIAQKIKSKMEAGGSHGLVIATENLGIDEISRKLAELSERRVRLTVLGHLMRGGNPTFADRTTARGFGETAARMLLENQVGNMVCIRGGGITSAPLSDVLNKIKELDIAQYKAVNGE